MSVSWIELCGVVLSRRGFLQSSAAAGALLLANPRAEALASPTSLGGDRRSRLFPHNGTMVVHSDLHNHSLLSDGATPAEEVFAMMRDAGLEVAALTDHAVFGKVAGAACASGACTAYVGINEDSWRRLQAVADANHRDGDFVAMRGFEWTTGTIGHVNVWFSEQWIDSFTTNGIQSVRGAPVLLGVLPEPGPALEQELGPLVQQLPENASIDLFYEWLEATPDRPVLGGGADALAGFNHPNLYGDFEDFKMAPALVPRMVSIEAMNGHDDYLFWGLDEGEPSPLNACLNAGWKVGMLGVSDEHGDAWNEHKARAGLWVKEMTRAGVREAMEARRFYATFEPGLRLDAAAAGVQMGGTVVHRSGPLSMELDLDRGPDWYGRTLNVQVLRPGATVPTLADAQDVRVPAPGEPLISLEVPIDLDDGDWVLLRVTDPDQPADPRAPSDYAGLGRVVAYASPFFLTPGREGSVPAAEPTAPAPAPATGVGGAGVLPATGAAGALAAGAAGITAALAARRLLPPGFGHPHTHEHGDGHGHGHEHDH